jgi:hypothetical protein
MCTVLLVGLATWAVDAPQVKMAERVGADNLVIDSHAPFDRAIVKVSGPAGYELSQVFESGISLQVDLLKGRLAEVEQEVSYLDPKALQVDVAEEEATNLTYQAPAPEEGIQLAAREKSDAAAKQALTLPDGRYSYEVRLWARGEEIGVFSGVFFAEDGVALSREAVRSRMDGTREDLSRESGGEATTKSYYTTDYMGVSDGVNDGITTFSLDSDAPVTSAYVDMSNVNGNIRFGTNSSGSTPGTPRLTIEKAGQIGIGTTAPSSWLDIASTVPAIRMTDTGTAQVWVNQMLNDDWEIRDTTASTTPFHIEHGAIGNSLYISTSGYTGFGTSSPSHSIDVLGQFQILNLERSTGSSLRFTTDNISTYIRTKTSSSTETSPIHLMHDAPSSSLDISANGVGIGTDNPTRKLHVVPDVAGQVVALFQNGTHEISRSDGGYSNIRFATSGGAVTQSYLFQNSPVNGEFVIRNETTPGNPLRIQRTAPTNSLVMTGVGVGIGTGSPAGKLDVNGSIYQRGGLIHADYVFEPEYDLPTIEEHASLMWSKSHLPAVPPRQVDEAGREVVDIGAQRRGILEELEVAHIYIEQLEKRMAQQEERLNQLEALLAEHE